MVDFFALEIQMYTGTITMLTIQPLWVILFKKIALLLLIGYVVVGIALMFMQRSFIYFPPSATSHGLNEMTIRNGNESLKIIVSDGEYENAIIYFGGNAEAVYGYYHDFSHHFGDHSLYLVNYRGYGGSSGTPSESGLYEDALLLYDTIKPKHKNITVIGRSLGSGVATYLAARRDVGKLVLITPFDSLEAVASAQYTIYPISWMLFDKYDSIGRVKDIKAPTLILIAGDDTLIPNENSMRLYRAFRPDQADIRIFEGLGHNTIQSSPDYYRAMREFIDR